MFADAHHGASQFAGGGFMQSPAPGHDAGPSSSQRDKGRNVQTMRAATVRQLYNATKNTMDDQFVMDGADLNQVTLVGKLAQVQQTADGSLHLVLDDGTGKIETQYYQDDVDQAEQPDWKAGQYVRTFGRLQTFDGKLENKAFAIRRITDYNEVTYHFLECLFEHLRLTRGSAPAPAAAASKGPAMGGAPAFGAGPGAFAASAPAGNVVGSDGLTPIQRELDQLLQQPDALRNDEGISLEALSNKLGGRYNPVQIREAIDFLVNEGHAYSTTDEVHYRTTKGS